MEGMGEQKTVEDICRVYCSFYRPDKDEALACRGITAAERLLKSESGLPVSVDPADRPAGPMSHSNALRLSDMLCPTCDFQLDGCDFIEWVRGHRNEWPSPSPPCGGFEFLCHMLEKGRIDFDTIKKVLY